MKLGVIIESFKKPFDEALALANSLDLQGIQVYATQGDFDPDTITPEFISKVKEQLKGYGMEISAFCGDMGGHGFAIEKDNPERIAKTKRIVDLANTFDCHIVTSHIGVIPEDEDSEIYKSLFKACSEIAKYAESKNSYFAIETGPEKVKTLKRFIEKVGSKGLAVNYDPANLYMVTHEDEVEGVYQLKDYIVHTHGKDGLRGKKYGPTEVYHFFAEGGIEDLNLAEYFIETPLGEGGVSFDRYVNALKEIGYNGYITIEREVADTPVEDIKLAVDFLRKYKTV